MLSIGATGCPAAWRAMSRTASRARRGRVSILRRHVERGLEAVLVGLGARRRALGPDPPLDDEPEAGELPPRQPRHVLDRHQPGDLDVHPGRRLDLAHRRGLEILAGLDRAGGQIPAAPLGFPRLLHHQVLEPPAHQDDHEDIERQGLARHGEGDGTRLGFRCAASGPPPVRRGRGGAFGRRQPDRRRIRRPGRVPRSNARLFASRPSPGGSSGQRWTAPHHAPEGMSPVLVGRAHAMRCAWRRTSSRAAV